MAEAKRVPAECRHRIVLDMSEAEAQYVYRVLRDNEPTPPSTR